MASIQKRKDSYLITVTTGRNDKGQKIRQSITYVPKEGMTAKQIEKEVKRQATLFEEQIKNGLYINNTIKFADFISLWFKDYAEKNLRANTISTYKCLVPRINDALGHLQISKIQPHHIIAFYNNLAETGVRNDIKCKSIIDLRAAISANNLTFEGLSELSGISVNTIAKAVKNANITEKSARAISSALKIKYNETFEEINSDKALSGKTMQHYHRLLSTIFSTAVNWQIIVSNPCERVKAPKVEKKEVKYLDETESLKLIDYLNKDAPAEYRTLYILILFTGLRRAEALGIEWSDIDFTKKTLDINKTSNYLPEKGIFEDETKNATSNRVLSIPDYALSVLAEWKKTQAENRIKLGSKWENSNKVFTSWNGRPIHPSTATNWFSDFVKKYDDIPNVSVHSLRHTNISLMIFAGINIETVSKLAGHATPTTTGNIYAHQIKKANEAAAEAINGILAPKAIKQA